MFEYLYEWLQSLAGYLVLVTALLQILPGKDYEKYVRFFCGMVLILLVGAPLLRLGGLRADLRSFRDDTQYEQSLQEMEEAARFIREAEVQAWGRAGEDPGADVYPAAGE